MKICIKNLIRILVSQVQRRIKDYNIKMKNYYFSRQQQIKSLKKYNKINKIKRITKGNRSRPFEMFYTRKYKRMY